MRFGTLVHATALALTLLPAVAGAQVAGDEPIPNPVPLRVEIGAVAGFTVAYLGIGALASVPIGPRTAFEVGFGWLPRVRRPDASYDSASEHFLVQAQFRMPFRTHLRSRKQPADRRDPSVHAKRGPLRQQLLGRRRDGGLPARRHQPAVASGALR